MFELIRANKRRSAVLVTVMLLVLLALGFAIGGALVPSVRPAMDLPPRGDVPLRFDLEPGLAGMGVAFAIWFVQCLIAYFQGGRILLSVSGARPIEKADHPQLFNVVEEMSIAAQLPKPPQVYIIDDMAFNAFATGRDPDNAAVAVTAGLLARANRDQLQGVVAHEIAHIVHRDVLFMTMAGVMVGTVVMISDVFLRSMRHTRYGSSNSKRGGGGGIMLVVAIVLAIVAPMLTQALYFACSRRREYLADAGAAVYTRYPEGLASALELIVSDSPPMAEVSPAVAPMYIANPLDTASMKSFSLFATHPPASERIRILRSLVGTVSYGNYATAWQRANRGTGMPRSAMTEAAVPIRGADPSAGQDSETRKVRQRQMRDTGDLLRKTNQYLFLNCLCGLRIKLPPGLQQNTIACPRCQRTLQVPVAQLATAAALATAMQQDAPAPASEEPLHITHTGGWMTFQCSCGTRKQLGPSFHASEVTCSACGRSILVDRQG